MRIHHERIAEIDRYIENFGKESLESKLPYYERYIRYIEKVKKINPSMQLLEIGTGTGWFPMLCQKHGLKCKGLEISPQLIELAMQIGEQNGLAPDIELGNVEDDDIGKEKYDVIVASSVFEHVEHWRAGLKKAYDALKPGGVLFFESTNKFMMNTKASEYQKIPLYGWLPDWARYRFRMIVHGKDVMKLGIDFNQFTYPLLRRTFRELGFRKIVDVIDLLDVEGRSGAKLKVIEAARSSSLMRHFVLTFLVDATTFVCVK